LREFFELFVEVAVMVDSIASGLLLSRSLEQELIDLTDGQALGQIMKGAMFVAAVTAVTLGLTAAGETLDQGSAEGVWEDFELREQQMFALAQGQRRFAGGAVYPSHLYG
jgi:hypothetical protein